MAAKRGRDMAGVNALKRRLNTLASRSVDFGVLEGSKNSDGDDIAEYASANEFGNSRVPSRPAFRLNFDANLERISDVAQSAAGNVMMNLQPQAAVLNALGSSQSNSLRKFIESTDIAPRLKPETVKRKGTTKTLIDTGAMVEAIKHRVNK